MTYNRVQRWAWFWQTKPCCTERAPTVRRSFLFAEAGMRRRSGMAVSLAPDGSVVFGSVPRRPAAATVEIAYRPASRILAVAELRFAPNDQCTYHVAVNTVVATCGSVIYGETIPATVADLALYDDAPPESPLSDEYRRAIGLPPARCRYCDWAVLFRDTAA